jgi:hypothetical protein
MTGPTANDLGAVLVVMGLLFSFDANRDLGKIDLSLVLYRDGCNSWLNFGSCVTFVADNRVYSGHLIESTRYLLVIETKRKELSSSYED